MKGVLLDINVLLDVFLARSEWLAGGFRDGRPGGPRWPGPGPHLRGVVPDDFSPRAPEC